MKNIVELARDYATSAHARINQLRKYSLQPYDVHLRAVAELVSSRNADQNMIAAAWLHDTVEDTPATFEDIEREFGSDVMNLVKELTDVSKPGDGNRAARKELDRQHLATVSPRAKTIKLADLIDNCRDICRHDPKFGRVYLAEMEALLHVLTEGDRKLYEKAVKLLTECARKLGHQLTLFREEKDNLPNEASLVGKFAGQHGIRLFIEAFTARDVQEPLSSFDADSLPGISFNNSLRPAPGLYGIRTNGQLTGYIMDKKTAAVEPGEIRMIDPLQIVPLETSLTDVIHVLTRFDFCFVHLDGAVVGVIGRGDIEKPVVRMWLFGIIILIEMLAVDLIRSNWKGEEWTARITPTRVAKARELQEERIRRGRGADLLDCLQFSDKIRIAMLNPAYIESAGFNSASAAKKTLNDLETLRNNLAHGQDITSHDWPQIVRLARRIQQLYGSS